jgi:hypothetical protein
LLITTDSTTKGIAFLIAQEAGKKALVLRDGQRRYVYTAQDQPR